MNFNLAHIRQKFVKSKLPELVKLPSGHQYRIVGHDHTGITVNLVDETGVDYERVVIPKPTVEAPAGDDMPPHDIEASRSGHHDGSGNGNGQPDKPSDLERLSKKYPAFIGLDDLPGDAEVDWVWGRYMALGHLTLFTARWKIGKTTLLAHVLRAFGSGGNVVGDVTPNRVLYISEESAKIWKQRQAKMHIGSHVQIAIKPFYSRPTIKDWTEYCRFVSLKAVADGCGVVIIDTISRVWSCLNENDASEVGPAMAPLDYLTKAGLAVLIVHHPKKGPADVEGEISIRGSGAIAACTDINLEMRKLKNAPMNDRRRILCSEGRFEETEREQVIEWTGDDYRIIGGKGEATREERWAVIDTILPVEGSGPGLTAPEVRKLWPADAAVQPAASRAHYDDLRAGTVGLNPRYRVAGAGKKGDPLRFHRLAGFVFVPKGEGVHETNYGARDQADENAISHVVDGLYSGGGHA